MGIAFSMTGFGKCDIDNQICRQQWEIRSVNGRYLDIKWKLPKIVRSFEHKLEKIVKRHARRGRLEISLNILLNPQFAPKPVFDCETAVNMLNALQDLANRKALDFTPELSNFLLQENLWSEPQLDSGEIILKELEDGLAVVLTDWNQSRQLEGELLVDDLSARVLKLRRWLEKIIKLAPELWENRKLAFQERIYKLLQNCEVDPARVNQELVIICDRYDASEELTRLSAHITRLEELLKNSDSDLGRRMEFTLQECFREINTCGNKLLDSKVSDIVIDFKNELEKCREQTMNLE